ncbi:hypothetical protein ABIA32_000848 [Streptacidiphilus sp. MAP12-20]|uniref:hypothetical protein n=1 Tax=Streptacidiphilus sp. MAP12-20 TaxID=3156299 RepID=UPI0035177AF1
MVERGDRKGSSADEASAEWRRALVGHTDAVQHHLRVRLRVAAWGLGLVAMTAASTAMSWLITTPTTEDYMYPSSGLQTRFFGLWDVPGLYRSPVGEQATKWIALAVLGLLVVTLLLATALAANGDAGASSARTVGVVACLTLVLEIVLYVNIETRPAEAGYHAGVGANIGLGLTAALALWAFVSAPALTGATLRLREASRRL